MEELIKNQISNEIFKKISELEKEKNQEEQKVIAQEIINELNIEDFIPYLAYDEEGDIFIAMNYHHSSFGIEEVLMSGKHDVVISSDGIYIDDIDYLESLKNEYRNNLKNEEKELKKEKIKEFQNQKKYDEISEKLEFLNNQLMNLVNFERPKCVGNYEKIIKIDKEIEELEKNIQNLEFELKELEK